MHLAPKSPRELVSSRGSRLLCGKLRPGSSPGRIDLLCDFPCHLQSLQLLWICLYGRPILARAR
jgi:hypothetical protein